MKCFFTQPEFQLFILPSFILIFTGDVTPQTIVFDSYNGPGSVYVGKQVVFTGRLDSQGNSPAGFSFALNTTSSSSTTRICGIDFSTCSSDLAVRCYCKSQVGDVYEFVVNDTAALEKSLASIFLEKLGNRLGTASETYPVIIPEPTTTPTTGSTTQKSGSDSDDILWKILGPILAVIGVGGVAGLVGLVIWWKKKNRSSDTTKAVELHSKNSIQL